MKVKWWGINRGVEGGQEKWIKRREERRAEMGRHKRTADCSSGLRAQTTGREREMWVIVEQEIAIRKTREEMEYTEL